MTDKTRKAMHIHRTDETENDCCSPGLDWQWILRAHVAKCISWDSSRSSHQSATFNIKFQLIYMTYLTNFSNLSPIAEMSSKFDQEENQTSEGSFGRKLGKGDWNVWDRKLRIEIAEFDEVVKEIVTGEMADFDTEDMEEDVMKEAVYDEELNCISPRKLETVPKKKFCRPNWSS